MTMNNISNWKDGFMYSKWYFVPLIIIGAAIVIGLLFSIIYDIDFTFSNVILHSIISTAVIWGGCMTIVVYSWKRFPWESKPVKHLFIEVSLIVLLLVLYISGISLINLIYKKIGFWTCIQENRIEIVLTVLITFLITTIHEAVFFYQQWKLNFSKSISLEKDNLEAQYNALKAQVNPHFLFNSLNSLMSLLENNPKAEQYLQDLSDYLRYVLLSNEHEAVTLKEELENLEKYIHLQKLRFGENLDVEISISVASLNLKIPPLVLQMLFDNCVKHNIISSQNPLKIRISDHDKCITVENNLQKKQTLESTGQGLKNIEGRFRFVTGEAIKIVSDDKKFSVTVPLIIQEKND